MAFNRDQLKSDLIDQLSERIHTHFEGARATHHFVREFYAHVPPDDILKEEPAALTL